MPPSKFNLDDLTRDVEVVAVVVRAPEAFSLLHRTLDLPPFWAALVTTVHGERRVHAAGTEVDGAEAEEVMLVRTGPIGLQYRFDRLSSQDGYVCTAELSVAVRVVAEPGELAACRENMIRSRQCVRVSDLRAELEPFVREGAARLAKSQPARVLIDGSRKDDTSSAVQSTLEPQLFSLGLSFGGLEAATFESLSYRQVRQQRLHLEHQRQEHDLKLEVQRAIEQARGEHLAHLQELLDRLKTLAKDSPQAHLADLLKAFDASQRGELYEALWAGEEAEGVTRWLVAVCGCELLYFDPASPAQATRRIQVETSLGPLRSVAYCLRADATPVLLIGAARGALVVHAESADTLGTYTADVSTGCEIRGGFNSVTLAGEYVVGAHSELGLWRWRADAPDTAAALLGDATAGARAVRQVQFAEGRIFVAIDSRIHSMTLGDDAQALTYEGSRDTVAGLLCCEGWIFAGTAAGEVLRWSAGDPASVETLYRGSGRAVETIGRLTTGGVERLLFSDTSAAVHACVIGDAFRCQYRAGGQTIRRAEYAPDWIVGTNETRDRLFCWKTGRPATAPTVLALGQLTGRSIQDVCLVPQLPAAS